eukprot:scaffold324248_cov66-Tisochrysis_lutea.AAC.1
MQSPKLSRARGGGRVGKLGIRPVRPGEVSVVVGATHHTRPTMAMARCARAMAAIGVATSC